MAKLDKNLINKEFQYKDITLLPNRLPDLEREEVDLTTSFTKKIKLKAPLVSSPMDTVTEAEMAILMALHGGIGVIHYNFETIDEQIKEIEKVKKFEAGFVFKPVVLSPQHTIKDVHEINKKYGFFSLPITEDGTLNSKLKGIVTHRDIRYRQDMESRLAEVMTIREKMRVAKKIDTVDKNDLALANKIIKEYNLDTLPIVDEEDRIVALVTDSDLKKNEQYPLATKNENKQLRVFMAVESRLELAKKRIGLGFQAGVDGVIVDAGIAFREQIEIARYAKENFPGLEIILGNIGSGEAAEKIIKEASAWCDGLRIGIGPGAACITQQELGTGRSQASAVWDCSEAAKRMEKQYGLMPVIADGGIKVPDMENPEINRPGDISKALALGAQTVMMGSLLAGLDEAPGEKEFDYESDKMIKKYRGMGSSEAMERRSGVRYGMDKVKVKVPEGKVIKVPYRGSGYDFLPKLIAGVRQSLQKQGFSSIKELQESADIRCFPPQ